MTTENLIHLSHYIPILTTFISLFFAYVILSRYAEKKEALYMLWWGLGILTYGAGTCVESINTLFGWSVLNFKLWYIFGALLGGGPLAIGSVYLLMGRKIGHIAVWFLLISVSVTSIFVILSPINMSLVEPTILNSSVLEWQQIRRVSPFINGLAGLFLIGGAFYSAFNFRKKEGLRNRYIGNIYIAIGAILPGIGGGFSRAGFTEALYVGEFIGILLIWHGYNYCRRPVIPDSVPQTT